jgi:hypothetical protein
MMRSTVALAVCSVLGVFALVCRAEACWQSGVPSVPIRSRSLAGTVTLNDKPIAGAVLSLHKFLGSYAIESGHAEAHALVKTIAAKDGSFDFGEVPTGKYVIVMASPSAESTEVEVVHPKSGESDRISISFFADYCQSASVISVTGKRLTHSTPSILGASGPVR